MKQDYKTKITNEIISSLQQGQIPWIAPFELQLIPMNYLTKRYYNGINLLSLWLTCQNCGYTSNYWVGFRQANKLDGWVKKGEKGTPITVCCPNKIKDNETDEETTINYFKTDYVFNLYSQIEGIDFDTVPVSYKPLKEFETLLQRADMKLRHQGERAYYSPNEDLINMPFRSKFKTQVAYYQTLSHELIHSTMDKTRCNRNVELTEQGRALEELTAEIGSAFLLAEFGLKANLQNSSAYVQSWIKTLKNDNNYIFKAVKLATAAVEWLKTKY